MVEVMDSEFEATITLIKIRNSNSLSGHITKFTVLLLNDFYY